MSIISKISGIFRKKKEEKPEPVEVKIVYAPRAKPGEPESEERRALLRHWLNKGEKPENVVRMEKSMGSVLGTKTKLAILGKKTVSGAGSLGIKTVQGAGSLGKKTVQGAGSLGIKTVSGAGSVIGAFGKGFSAGVRPVKTESKKLTPFELGYRAGNNVRGVGEQIGPAAPGVSLSGFDNAFDAFDFDVPATKKSKSRESKSLTLDEGFDTVFDGFKRFKW